MKYPEIDRYYVVWVFK